MCAIDSALRVPGVCAIGTPSRELSIPHTPDHLLWTLPPTPAGVRPRSPTVNRAVNRAQHRAVHRAVHREKIKKMWCFGENRPVRLTCDHPSCLDHQEPLEQSSCGNYAPKPARGPQAITLDCYVCSPTPPLKDM